MRVTQLEMYRNILFDLEALNSEYWKASRQVSSGKKLNQLSDSPSGSADLVSLSDWAAKIDLYRSNADTALFFLGAAESALNEVNNLVITVYTKGSQAASDTAGQDARSALAEEIRSLRAQILALANSEARGRYIFGGSQVTSPPFVMSGDSAVYQGDIDVNSIHILDGLDVQLGVPGSTAFDAVFESINALLAGLESNNSEDIKTALGQFSAALSHMGQVRVQIGTKLNILENARSSLESQEITLKTQKSKIEDADMTGAIVLLNQTQTALQAALAAGRETLSQRNLFDILG